VFAPSSGRLTLIDLLRRSYLRRQAIIENGFVPFRVMNYICDEETNRFIGRWRERLERYKMRREPLFGRLS